MENHIVFGEKVTTYSFYSDILIKFYNIYVINRLEVPPVMDFRRTKFINQTAVPVILAFGDYLSRLYNHSIELLYEKGSDLQSFFVESRFYEISKALNIFEWDDVYEGCRYEECEYDKKKKKKEQHKVSYTNTSYTDVEKMKDEAQKRNYIFDSLHDRSSATYEKILKEIDGLPDKVIDTTINAIAEIETNAVMYSNSYSFTYVASDNFGTSISIADSGIGFAKSFELENRPLLMLSKYKQFDARFNNYLVIMSVLNYSYMKRFEDNRADLWILRKSVVENNGTFKMSYGNTQVIFTSNRCGECKKCEEQQDISCCVDCLYDDYSPTAYSPIKIYNVGFQGVRVEITISKDK